MEWLEKQIKITPPAKPKKLTGTRFATILGLNPWSTPFEIFCAVSRVYEKPFEDTIYTAAGKTIEPKQAEYMKKSYFMNNLVSPTNVWGADYFKKTWGDFFPEQEILGGAWDYLLCDKDGNPTKVLEMKTTKRSEDWQKDIPEYYALQAALYAYLLGVDDVIMVASFLEDSDYEHPENFVPNATNTITVPFKLSERYPNFEKNYIKPAMNWWNKYVVKGISPEWDEKKDADILKALRTTTVDTAKEDLTALIEEAEALKDEIEANAKAMQDKVDRYKAISESFKKACMDKCKTANSKAELAGTKYKWVLSRSDGVELDTDAMKKDGIYDKYNTKPKTSYRLTQSIIK